MRVRLMLVGLVLLAAGCGGSGSKPSTTPPPPPPPPPPPAAPTSATVPGGTVKLVAPGHEVKVNAKWRYRVELRSRSGRPLPGRITVQIVDPLGTAHAATYDNTTQKIADRPFHGAFHDYLQFPPDARGFTLTVRVTVKTARGKGTIDYHVVPK